MPRDFLIKCVRFLENEFPEEVKEEIRELHQKEGINWIGIGHMFWGMGIRNALREAGFVDDNLPDKNWDDYYIPVVECAVGIRGIEKEGWS
jgi:hypothetical protein